MAWLKKMLFVFFVLWRRTRGCPSECRCTTTVTYCMYKGITTTQLEQFAPSIPQSTVKLYLSGNEITSLPLDKLKHLQKLTYLSASFNKLKELPQQIGKFLPKLKMLYLTANQIHSITAKELVGYHGIEVLNLDQNMISNVEDSTFLKMTNLRELLLGQNSLSVITNNTFRGLTNLFKLQLNNNKIKLLDENSFALTPNLQQIFLNVNQLSIIQSHLFSNVHNLRILYLNDNFIKRIDIGAFDNLEIDTVYLNTNRLTRLPVDLFTNTVVTGNVYLRDNLFICDCSLAFTVKQTSNVKLHFDKCSAPAFMKDKQITEFQYNTLNCTLCDIFSCPKGNRCIFDNTTDNYTCSPMVEDLKEHKITEQNARESPPPSYALWVIAVLCVLIFSIAVLILFIYIKNRRKRKAFEINRNIYKQVDGSRTAVLTGLTSKKESFNRLPHSPIKLKQYFV